MPIRAETRSGSEIDNFLRRDSINRRKSKLHLANFKHHQGGKSLWCDSLRSERRPLRPYHDHTNATLLCRVGPPTPHARLQHHKTPQSPAPPPATHWQRTGSATSSVIRIALEIARNIAARPYPYPLTCLTGTHAAQASIGRPKSLDLVRIASCKKESTRSGKSGCSRIHSELIQMNQVQAN